MDLDLGPLVTDRIPYSKGCEAYEMLLADRSHSLAVVLDWHEAT
jgi:hypothetical protein